MNAKQRVEASFNGLLTLIKSTVTRENVNEMHSGATCLTGAVLQNHVEIVKYLLSIGADPNTLFRGNGLLSIAIKFGFSEVATALINGGAQNVSNEPLGLHAAFSCPEVYELLVARGTPFNETADGSSTLHVAAHRNRESIVRFILSRSPEAANSRDDFDNTPLFMAFEYLTESDTDFSNVFQLLLPLTNVNAQNKIGTTVLMHAARNDKKEVVRKLLAAGADRNLCSQSKCTALHGAVCSSVECCKLIVDSTVDVNAADHVGGTPLMYAATESPEVVQYLLSVGANKAIKNLTGHTALDVAISNSCEECAVLLT